MKLEILGSEMKWAWMGTKGTGRWVGWGGGVMWEGCDVMFQSG